MSRLTTYDYASCKLDNSSRDIRVLIIRNNSNPTLEAELWQLDDEPYNALSWCWKTYDGDDKAVEQLESINIIHEDKPYSFQVSKNLCAALMALRKKNILRIWIDWLCIDQTNNTERSNQVQLMSRIYGNAKCVYVWLGGPDDDSRHAFDFIPRILEIDGFDNLIQKKDDNHKKWKAMKMLMVRQWFSRRWIIQEVALARTAVLLCGEESELDWSVFADAVSLFTEYETETRELSQIMKTRPEYDHIPDYFGNLENLSAARLVEITNRLFRERGDGHRDRLLSLEYLVSIFTTFDSSEARDTVYAILAIAKDTTPQTAEQVDTTLIDVKKLSEKSETLVKMVGHFATIHFGSHTASKPYNVDYEQPISDVYVEFVKFCIERAKQSDPSRALDILCRPWAPDPDFHGPRARLNAHWRAKFTVKKGNDGQVDKVGGRPVKQSKREPEEQPAWLIDWRRRRATNDFPSLDEIRSSNNKPRAAANLPKEPTESSPEEADTIPSWIPSKDNFSHGWTKKGGRMHGMIRKNPDPLVGKNPSQRLYSASKSKGVGNSLRFQEGAIFNPGTDEHNTRYHSLFAEGFVLGPIEHQSPASQNGTIPEDWAELVERHMPTKEMDGVPATTSFWAHPAANDFWRTLVADQSWTGKEPPRFYQRILKHAYDGRGHVDLQKLIDHRGCQPARAVCQRVQAVIWNRRLVIAGCESKDRPLKLLCLAPKLAEPGDLVCILYGCSVPVVLRKYVKSENVIDSETKQQQERREEQAWRKIYSFFVNTYYRLKLEKTIPELKEKLKAEKLEAEIAAQRQTSSSPTLPQRRARFTASPTPRRKGHANASVHAGVQSSPTPNQRQTLPAKPSNKRRAQSTTIDQNHADGSMAPPSKRQKKNLNGHTKPPSNTPSRQNSGSESLNTRSRQATPAASSSPSTSENAGGPPHEEFYKMIGECYVHGMMNGEAIDHQNIEKLSSILFEIR